MGNTQRITLDADRQCSYCGTVNAAGSKGVLNKSRAEFYGFECHRGKARPYISPAEFRELRLTAEWWYMGPLDDFVNEAKKMTADELFGPVSEKVIHSLLVQLIMVRYRVDIEAAYAVVNTMKVPA